MLYYYEVFSLDNKFLGLATSASLRYYNPRNKRILCTTEKLAQYVCVNDSNLYRVPWLNTENEDMRGTYPEVLMFVITKEQYDKIKETLEKEELE